MKKFFKNALTLLLIVPIIALCSCSGKSLQKVNFERYFESKVEVTTYKSTSKKNIDLTSLTSNKPNDSNYDSYTSFTLTADGTWLYKMYIEKIEFYIFTNEKTLEELIINFKMTNLVDESEYLKEDHSKIEPAEITSSHSFKTKSTKGAFICTIPINKVVANPQTTTITIDILDSVYGTLTTEDGELSTFRWQIYGLSMFGESRSYSEK